MKAIYALKTLNNLKLKGHECSIRATYNTMYLQWRGLGVETKSMEFIC